jgi:hypothetical protein
MQSVSWKSPNSSSLAHGSRFSPVPPVPSTQNRYLAPSGTPGKKPVQCSVAGSLTSSSVGGGACAPPLKLT